MRAAGLAEFVYKIPGTSQESRPGAHRSSSKGAGMMFASHARLFDHPDPRRLDLRASMTNISRDWLVRVNHQRSSVGIKVIVDVSASMNFGLSASKLDVVADFLEALGHSAHRYGDSISLLAFDHTVRDDLYMPARSGRGIGLAMAAAIKASKMQQYRATNTNGIAGCVEQIAGATGLVFILSDFHWPLLELCSVLNKLAGALVVPIVVWSAAETEPPLQGRLLAISDVESGVHRRLWLREKTRDEWRENVAARRMEITDAFGKNDIYPFHIDGDFNAESLSRYFLEKVV